MTPVSLRKRIRLPVLLAILAVIPGTPLAGQEGRPGVPAPGAGKKAPPVNVVVEVGHAEIARRGDTVPIRVTLQNGENPVNGRLEVRDFHGNVSETPVELPRKAQKRYTLYAPLEADIDHPKNASGELFVYDGRRVLSRQLLIPKYLEAPGMLVLSATGDGSGLQFLTNASVQKTLEEEQLERQGDYYLGMRNPFQSDRLHVAHLSPADLPRQWSGYRPASVVALNGRAWSGMDEEQRRALRSWIEMGGRAILCGESTLEWRDPDGQALAGVVPTDLRSLRSLGCVQRWTAHPYRAEAGALLTVSGPVRPGAYTQEIGWEDGRALIVPRRAGLGRVIWIGFDPFRETMRNWPSCNNFWRQLLNGAGRNIPASVPTLETAQHARGAVNALPRLPAPPMPVVIGFGVLYAAIFGPLNIWMLRQMRRTVRAWLVMPALAAVMTAAVLAAGQVWGSGRTVLNSVSLLLAGNGDRGAREETLAGLFSPTNRAFDFRVEDPAPELIDLGSADELDPGGRVDLGWPERQADGESRWERVALQLYATRMLHLKRPRDLGGAVEAALRRDRSGWVRNGTSLTLRDAFLHDRGMRCSLGELAPGARAALSPRQWTRMPAAASGGPATSPSTPVAAPAGADEAAQFRNAFALLKEGLVPATSPRSRTAWLVAEAGGFRGGLEVDQVPTSNQGAILLVRIDREE